MLKFKVFTMICVISIMKELDENNIPCTSTENYFPCGDLRELVEEKKQRFGQAHKRVSPALLRQECYC